MQSCNTCEQPARYFCHGCEEIFCENHANEHRQALYDQLDWLRVDHDDLIQTLDHTPLIKQLNEQSRRIIDQWEEESIRYIRQTASEARRALIDAIQTHIKEMKEKLEVLTEKFNIIPDKNNNILFDERNLKQWATELRDLKYDCLTTPNFTVRVYGNKPVVMPIIKIQPKTTDDNPLQEQKQQQRRKDSFGLISIKRQLTASNHLQENLHPRVPINYNSNSLSKDDDRFSLSTDYIKILDNGRLLLHDSTNIDASVRGSQEYSQGEHRLFFRLERLTSNQCIFFGIISKQASFNQRVYLNPSAYGWTGYNRVYISGKSLPVQNGCVNDMRENDLVELTLDCSNQRIIFWHSRQSYKTKLSVNIQTCPFPWQLLISYHNPNDSVRILPASMSSMIKREQEKLDTDMKVKEMNVKNDIELTIDTTDSVR